MHRVLALPALLLALSGCALFVRPEPATEPKEGEEVTAVSVSSIDSAQVPRGISAYWDKVRAGGPLKIGINERYPPFGVPVDPAKAGPEDGAFAGFDVDLANHLGRTLNVSIELVGIRSQEAMLKLNDGTVDLVMAGLTRTVFRAAQINFSEPYLNVSQAALVERRLADGSRGSDEERRRNTLQSYDDLRGLTGLKIGVVKWTRPHRLALNNFPDARILTYPTIQDVSRALISGEINALVHDDPYVRVWASFHPEEAGRFRELLQPVTEEPICIGMRKGDLEFLRFLDVYADEVRKDGTVDRIYRRQFIDGEWLRIAEEEERP